MIRLFTTVLKSDPEKLCMFIQNYVWKGFPCMALESALRPFRRTKQEERVKSVLLLDS